MLGKDGLRSPLHMMAFYSRTGGSNGWVYYPFAIHGAILVTRTQLLLREGHLRDGSKLIGCQFRVGAMPGSSTCDVSFKLVRCQAQVTAM